jgi:hypothetical protein
MAVVPPLNNFMGPEGDTVTVAQQLLNTEYCPQTVTVPSPPPKSGGLVITAGPITKLFKKFAGGGPGGGEWRTCAMIDDEPRPVWMSPLITH